MSRRAHEGGCAVSGAATEKRAVSPLEEVSARYCGDCQVVVEALEGLAGAGPNSDQAVFHLAAAERLRRLEMAAHDLVRRRIQAARVRGAGWDDVSLAVGLAEDEIKRTYPIWDTPAKNWGGAEGDGHELAQDRSRRGDSAGPALDGS